MTEEICHVRCIECGKVLANKWTRYQDLLGQGIKVREALSKIGLTRYCCRMRMMNPFKVPTRSDRQIDPRDTGVNDQMETLTIATGNPAPLAPLQAMANPQALPAVPTTQASQIGAPPNPNLPAVPGMGPRTANLEYTVTPSHGDIALPAIPQVALPTIPTQGADLAPEETIKVIRTYQAW